MGGGLMQLVAYGAQDIYLTGNPQITFFKVVYRRHTNFAMETVEQTIRGTSTLTGDATKGTVTISRNGDLVSKVYVTSDTASIEDGSNIVNEVSIEIGGQEIDKQYQEWNDIWNELSTSQSKAEGLKYMQGCLGSSGSNGAPGMVQIPLNFWFCRNPGLALPLIALQYHEVNLKFTWGTSTNVGAAADLKVWCDYVYLDTDERRRFAQVSHEYLIEQIQKQTLAAKTSNKLTLNHPVKELIWTSASDYTDAKLQLNGQDRFAAQQEEYFQIRQPLDHHTAIPGYNMKRSERPRLLETPINVSGGTAASTATIGTTDNTFEVLAATTSNLKLYSATGTDITIKVGDVLHISYAVLADTGTGGTATSGTGDVSITVTVDDIVTAPADTDVAVYTVSFVGGMTTSDTPIASIAGAGSVDIIARVQDPTSRCSELATNINVFSFALKPEEHQPSGTCNFSRIDSSYLVTGAVLGTSDVLYAVNYNVLRIMSGMGGLAYSN